MAKKNKSGRPKVAIDEKLQKTIERMAAVGMNKKNIAYCTGLSLATVKRRCSDIFRVGRAAAHYNVMNSAYEQAVSKKCPAMTMFWLKTQCGWREKDKKDIPPPIDFNNATTEELEAIKNRLDKAEHRAGIKKKI